jgi:drug/metabolite transporter (DMT)-like permease
MFLNERLTFSSWLGMSVTLAGVTWVVSERLKDESGNDLRHAPPSGLVLALIAAIGQAVGLVLGKRGLLNYPHAFAATQIRAVAGIIGFALLLLAIRDGRRLRGALGDARSMRAITLGAISGPLMGVSLLMLSLQLGVSTGVAQTMTAMVPVLIIPFVVFVKHERVTWRAVLGAAIAVAGVAILLLGP